MGYLDESLEKHLSIHLHCTFSSLYFQKTCRFKERFKHTQHGIFANNNIISNFCCAVTKPVFSDYLGIKDLLEGLPRHITPNHSFC